MIGFLSGIWGKIAAVGSVIAAILVAAFALEKKGESAGKAKIEAEDARISEDTARKVSDARAKVQSGTADQARADLVKNDIDPNL